MMGELAKRTLEIAASQVGVRETGPNTGPEVDQYLASVGLQPGAAWCAAEMSWCIKRAAKETSIAPKIHVTGSAMRFLALNSGLILEAPEVGALVVWDHGKGKGHVGIVEAIDGDSLIVISGNTNDNHSREGVACLRQQRPANDPRIAGYVRIE